MMETQRTSGRTRRILIAIVASIALFVGLAGAGTLAATVYAQGKLEGTQERLDPPGTGTGTPTPGGVGGPCLQDACNYLVLGSDSRSGLSAKDQKGFQSDAELGGGFRSDTIILVHVDAETREATIINFPRDLVVNIPGHGKDLINAAFTIGAENGQGIAGAMSLSAQTVGALTGLQINHVIVVDLEAFKAVVDAVDKVPYCTPVSLEDDPQAFGEGPENQGSGLDLKEGCHELDGDTALALVRARYVVAGGRKDCISDYARISRQQQFMRALINKMLSPAMVTRVPDVVDAVTREVKTDDDLDVIDVVDLAKNMQGVASGNADFRTVPTELDAQNIHLVLTPEGRMFLAKLRAGESLGDLGTSLAYQPPTPAEIAVRVFDDASEGHAQNDVYTAQLSNAGFKMLATGAEPAGELVGQGTAILYAPGQKEKAAVLSGFVPSVEIKAAKPGQLPDDTDVGVVVDASYKYHDPGEGQSEQVSEKCPFT
ncbi:MAG: LCP family protein [Actinomycetota bacterium]